MSFKKNKYQVIRNAISKEIADIAYTYLQISAEGRPLDVGKQWCNSCW